MTVSTSRAAYEDCFHLLDRATWTPPPASATPAPPLRCSPPPPRPAQLRPRPLPQRTLRPRPRRSRASALPPMTPSSSDSTKTPPRWWVYIEPRRSPRRDRGAPRHHRKHPRPFSDRQLARRIGCSESAAPNEPDLTPRQKLEIHEIHARHKLHLATLNRPMIIARRLQPLYRIRIWKYPQQ